jgi:hypothetical protein
MSTLFSFLSVSDWSNIQDMDCRDYYRVGLVDKLDVDEIRLHDGEQDGLYKVGKLYNRLSKIGRIIYDCLSSVSVDWSNSRLLQIKDQDY